MVFHPLLIWTEELMSLKATPLNNAHRATDVGMFDVSHMCVVDLEGDHVRGFLRGLLANNVDKLQASGKALYSCMLTPQGHVIDDLIVYFINENWFRLVVNAGTAE